MGAGEQNGENVEKFIITLYLVASFFHKATCNNLFDSQLKVSVESSHPIQLFTHPAGLLVGSTDNKIDLN